MIHANQGIRWLNNPARKVGKTQLRHVMRAEKTLENARYQHYLDQLKTQKAPADGKLKIRK